MVAKDKETQDVAPLWERQPCDTDESWPCFVEYRDQTPPRRALRTQSTSYKRLAPFAQIAQWSREHEWPARVAAYDAHLDEIKRSEVEAIIRQSVREVQGEHLLLIKDFRELLDRELQKFLKASAMSDMHGLLKPAELLKLFELNIKLHRLVMDLPTEIVEEHRVLSKRTPQELELLAELERRVLVDGDGKEDH